MSGSKPPESLPARILTPLNAGGGNQLLFPYFSFSGGGPDRLWEKREGEGDCLSWSKKEHFSQNNPGPSQPSLALACPSISLSKYLEGRKVSQKLLCIQVGSGLASGSDTHLFRVPDCPPQAPTNSTGPLPSRSKSQTLSASWDPATPGPAPGLPSLLISHQTWKPLPPPSKGEARGRRD